MMTRTAAAMKGGWVLLLGANSDIARATAKRFAEQGFNLYLASRNLDEMAKTAADLTVRYAVQVQCLNYDGRDCGSHAAFWESLGECPEIVVAALGTMYSQEEASADFALARDMIETNYLGLVSILELAARDFSARKRGVIVGISSVAGDRGRQSNYVYGSSKAALTAYLAGLHHRLFADDVTVVTVKPGFVDTKMTAGMDLPAALTARPEEVAEAIVRGVKKRKATVYVKPVWKLIMMIVIHLPEFLFVRTKL